MENNPHLQPKPKPKIIDSIPMLLIGVATLGPFALPLLWRNPRFSKKMKWGWSIGVILFTIWLVKFGMNQVNELLKTYSAVMEQ